MRGGAVERVVGAGQPDPQPWSYCYPHAFSRRCWPRVEQLRADVLESVLQLDRQWVVANRRGQHAQLLLLELLATHGPEVDHDSWLAQFVHVDQVRPAVRRTPQNWRSLGYPPNPSRLTAPFAQKRH